MWPAVNKYPDSGLECLKTTAKLINNTVSNQHTKCSKLECEENCEKLDTGTESCRLFCIVQLASGEPFSIPIPIPSFSVQSVAVPNPFDVLSSGFQSFTGAASNASK